MKSGDRRQLALEEQASLVVGLGCFILGKISKQVFNPWYIEEEGQGRTEGKAES